MTTTLGTLLIIVLKCFWITNIEYEKKKITVPEKTLFLVLPYLGPLSLQNRTKLRKSLKAFLIVTSYRLCLKVKAN